jgi:uncharacterized protein (TIGR00295 family)
MDDIPSSEDCIKLLVENGCSESVIGHCKAVTKLSVIIAKKAKADVDLVNAGALLHDIGRSKTHGIRHAIEGVKIAIKIGLSNSIILIIERHIGAGLTADIAYSVGLPKKDFIPQTLEEKIVCHADNLINDCKRQPVEAEVEKALSNGYKDYAIRLVKLHKELSDICKIDLNNI